MSSGLELMKKRLSYQGYDTADGRNVSGKYKSFLAALKESYQAEWITLNKDTDKEQKYRCLINPSRLTEDFDKKVISIDYDSGVREGTVFWWDRTQMYWMINLQQHTEEAYFRGLITRAEYELDLNGKHYWAIVRGPIETTTVWHEKHNLTWNDLNYSLVLQIPKNSDTVHFFSRHNKIKIKLAYPDIDTGEIMEEFHTWKVVATDKYSSDFLIDVYLDEWNDNPMEDAMREEAPTEIGIEQPHISGSRIVHGYDSNLSFSIVGKENGVWSINNTKVAKIISSDSEQCVIDILTGKANSFNLIYKTNDDEIVEQITIKSL